MSLLDCFLSGKPNTAMRSQLIRIAHIDRRIAVSNIV
jgi:hypothetical protein